MKRIAKATLTLREFNEDLAYLTNEAGEHEHPLLIATAENVLARLDHKTLRLAYDAFQFGYILAQVETAAKWGESHRKVERKTLEKTMKEAVAKVKQLKQQQPKRTYKYIEEVVAEEVGECSPRTIRRWRKELGK